MTTILLGPQRFTVTVAAVVRSLELDGPVAMINSGWEEREDDDGELSGHFAGAARNLRLHHRLLDAIEKDPQFAADARTFRNRHDELRAFYGIRLQAAVDAVDAVRHRTSIERVGPAAEQAAVEAVRDVDAWYTYELEQLYADVAASSGDQSGPIGWHRGEVGAMLDECAAVVIAGGNVRTLLRTLRLFRVTLPADRPVVAWSAGAMALTGRVVLFNDFASQGIAVPELHDTGLGRLPHVVALPHARRRLRLDDRERMSLLVRRFRDDDLLLLDDGTVVRIPDEDAGLPAGARTIGTDGAVTTSGTVPVGAASGATVASAAPDRTGSDA
jgi:hypothetical protein